MRSLMAICCLLLLGVQVLADESEYIEMARTRSYIGGPDESDLKVQTSLYVSPSKKKKTVIKVEPGEGF